MSSRDEIFSYIKDNIDSITQANDDVIDGAIKALDKQYAFKPDEEAFEAMKGGFKNLLLITTKNQILYGTIARGGTDVKAEDVNVSNVLDNLITERDYQDTKVREKYGTQGKEFTATQELTMIHAYRHRYNDFEEEIQDNARKIGAMSLRWLETNSDRQYTEDLVL